MTETPDITRCPDGCGCRLATDDADRGECGCGGPCVTECRENGYPDAPSYRDLTARPTADELPVAVLNVSIATEDGTYQLRTITEDEARNLAGGRDILSAVGHEATAQILTAILGRDVPVNRVDFRQQPGQVAIVCKLRRRLPEGAIIGVSEMDEYGYDLKVMERLA